MKIEIIKEKMLQWKDFYGGDISDVSAIKNAKSKKELAEILNRHSAFLEDMLSDAMSHLEHFKKELGVSACA